MTNLSDIIQTGLNSLLGCLILAVATFQAFRVVSGLWRDVIAVLRRYVVPVWRPLFWLGVGSFAGVLYLLSYPLSAALQWMEYNWFAPVYAGQMQGYDDAHKVAVYESVIQEKCDPYEFQVVKQRTAEIAARINSTPVAIYETALLECGLNPFRVRDDRVAAGWIQFTTIGLNGLGVTLPEVIAACNRHDINFVMDLTEKYLVRKWEKAGKPDMRNTIDLYLAVFAPAHIGAEPERVVYAGFGNRAYDLNSGLDGWYLDGGKICRGRKDGKIEVWEIYLALERKKGLILKR